MSLMARTVPNERVLGPVRRMGRSLCSLTRRLDRSPEWARIVKGMLEMPEKGLKLGNLRRPVAELSVHWLLSTCLDVGAFSPLGSRMYSTKGYTMK